MNMDMIGMQVPQILLPGPEVDLKRWAVVACDQYTAQRDYWESVEAFVGTAPSTLRLMLPEVYLEDADSPERIQAIRSTMAAYLKNGILAAQGQGMIYVERETARGRLRRGLVTALDLEAYDYRPGSDALIRATEGTVLERIPPRTNIRSGAVIELPHIMVLIDDPEHTVIEPLADWARSETPLYDTELMMDSGCIRGYGLWDKNGLEAVAARLGRLADPAVFGEKMGIAPTERVLLYAVGDGNHSLAAAKALWEQRKGSVPFEQQNGHPARYALVELVNVHDPGLEFEPIHRVLFHTQPASVLAKANAYFAGRGLKSAVEAYDDWEALERRCRERTSAGCHAIPCVHQGRQSLLWIAHPEHNLAAGTLQSFIDDFLSASPAGTVDYVHGADVVRSLSEAPQNIGFLLPPMAKGDLFKTVYFDGVLPRKTFSMGEADEKRFYMECRRITR